MDDILAPKRDQDAGNDLWRTFNRAQEHLLMGNFPIYHQTPSGWTERTARPIKAIDSSNQLNTSLWALAESFLHGAN
jgi:hypothetical protein